MINLIFQLDNSNYIPLQLGNSLYKFEGRKRNGN